MAASFECPNCSAPIDFGGQTSSVPCPYCGTTVIVPEELRPQAQAFSGSPQVLDLSAIMAELRAGRKIEAIKLYRAQTGLGLREAKEAVEKFQRLNWDGSGTPVSFEFQVMTTAPVTEALPQARRSSGLVWLAILGVFLAVIGAAVVFSIGSLIDPLERLQATLIPSPTAVPSPTPYARTALGFGSEGDGAGYFKDARSLALDSRGRIFVGDYIPGRIQAFAADGTFLWQYLTEKNTDYVYSLAAGPDGRLYAAVGRNIQVLEAETGRLLATWEAAAQSIGYYTAMAVTPKGEILAAMARELLKFDPQGKVLLSVGGVKEDFLKLVGVKDGSARVTGMAVDGSGIIYIGTSGNFILKLDENGKLIDRLNGEETSGGGVHAIAVDGQGRIAWGYSSKITLTNREGRYLGEFETPYMRDMKFNIQGQLVAVHLSAPHIRTYSFGP